MTSETPANVFGPKLQETYDKLAKACLTNSILVEQPDLMLITYGSELRVQDVPIPESRLSLHFDKLHEHRYIYTGADAFSMEEMQNQIIALSSIESNSLLLSYLLQNSEMANTVILGETFEKILPNLKELSSIIMSIDQFKKYTSLFTDVTEAEEGQIAKAKSGDIVIYGLPEVYNTFVGNKIMFMSKPNLVGLFKRTMTLDETKDEGIIVVSQCIATKNRAAVLTMIRPEKVSG